MPAGHRSCRSLTSSQAGGTRSAKIIRRRSSTRKRCRAKMWADPEAGIDLSAIKNIVAVHRLAGGVVPLRLHAIRGGTDERATGKSKICNYAVAWAPISRDADWLPAIEQFGEGMFIQFDEAAIGRWLASGRGQSRHERLSAAMCIGRSGSPEPAGISGNGIRAAAQPVARADGEIALDCGYPASALKERVYALSDLASRGRSDRCGILIYTATAGAQGTLGGLVGTATRIASILRNAVERSQICSNDPVCADHEPDDRSGDRATHGAACHGCLLIAETSCEMRNLFLDRSLITPTMAEDGACFFGPHEGARQQGAFA